MIIRRARPDDTASIGALWLELVAYHRQLDEAMPVAADDGVHRYESRIGSQIDDPYSCVLVAEADGQVVGYVTAMIVDMLPDVFLAESTGFLGDIYVQPDRRGQGIGRDLVQAVKDWLRARGVHNLEWYVAAENADGLRFWRAMGGRAIMLRMQTRIDP